MQIPTSAIGTPLEPLLRASNQYISLAMSLRKLVELTPPTSSELSDTDAPDERLKHLTPAQQASFRTAMGMLGDVLNEAFDGEGIVNRSENGVALEVHDNTKTILIDDREVAFVANKFFMDVIGSARLPEHELVLNRSLLTTAVSGFETLMHAMFRFVLLVNPALTEDSDHAFTLRELEGFDTIDNAREEIIRRKCYSMVSGGIDGWRARFARKDLSIPLEQVADHWPSLREIFARRNIIVHNDAVADQQYVAALKALNIGTRDLPQVGTQLDVRKEYLTVSIERLMSFAVALTLRVVSQVRADLVDRAARWLLIQQGDLMRHALWDSVVDALDGSKVDQLADRKTGTLLRRNRWIAMRELGQDEKMRLEVEAWDTSGLEPELAQIKPALLLQIGECERLLSSLIRDGTVSVSQLHTDPLYRPLLENRKLIESLASLPSASLEVATPARASFGTVIRRRRE